MSKNTIQKEARFRQLMDEMSGEPVRTLEEYIKEEKESRARHRAFKAEQLQALRDDAALMEDFRVRLIGAVGHLSSWGSLDDLGQPTTRRVIDFAINGDDGGLGHLLAPCSWNACCGVDAVTPGGCNRDARGRVRKVMREVLAALEVNGVLKSWESSNGGTGREWTRR